MVWGFRRTVRYALASFKRTVNLIMLTITKVTVWYLPPENDPPVRDWSSLRSTRDGFAACGRKPTMPQPHGPPQVIKLPHVNIETHARLTLGQLHEASFLYADAFHEISALAVQQHMMGAGEFIVLCADTRIEKWIARDPQGTMIGLGVQTTDLYAWPLISPAYFERRWPKLYAEHKIWYVGFVCTRQDPPAPVDTFGRLIRAMSAPTRAVGGISAMDFCAANTNRDLPRIAERLLSSAGPLDMSVLDKQSFYAFDFGGGSEND
jgi:hypothetical protein